MHITPPAPPTPVFPFESTRWEVESTHFNNLEGRSEGRPEGLVGNQGQGDQIWRDTAERNALALHETVATAFGDGISQQWNNREPNDHDASIDLHDEDDAMSTDGETSSEGTYRFFRSLLQSCAHGFSSIDSGAHTAEVRRAMLACQLGLDYLDALANKADGEAAEKAKKLEAVSNQSIEHNDKINLIRQRRQMPRLPAEILLRVFNFVCYNGGSGGYVPPKAVRTLFSCSLVARDWSQPANAILWKRIYLADQPARFGRFVLGSATSKYNKRESSALVRVLSVACTDEDLSLLSVACHHTTGLHSLELHRTRNMDAASYRLLQRLPDRFPTLRSLVADTIHPSAWGDIVRLGQSCPLLSNLHISFAAADTFEMTLPNAADFEALFSCIPFLQSLSLWRVPLPSDEDTFATPLATHCRNLRAIRIDDCGIDLTMGLIVNLWNRCRQLQCVTLRMIRRPPQRSGMHLEALPTLKTLLLDGCWLSDELLACIGRNSPNLETLYIENDWRDEEGSIGSVVHVTDRGVLSLAPHLRNLRTVSLVGLMGGPHLTARSVRALLSYNRNVSALNLARPEHALAHLTDEIILDLAPCLTNIRRLEMYMQTKLSEDALAQCLSDAYCLVSLGLSGCHQLTDSIVSALPQLCPMLERVDMAGVGCSVAGLQKLVDGARFLRECVVDVEAGEGVRWGKVVNFDDPWSEDVFSPYSVWEKEVRRVARIVGFVY